MEYILTGRVFKLYKNDTSFNTLQTFKKSQELIVWFVKEGGVILFKNQTYSLR